MSEVDDVSPIRALIEGQFASLSWGDDTPPDWAAFAADFYPGASLFPAARPIQEQSVEAFVHRMKALAGDALQTFQEKALGSDIRVFGNVAVATTACEMVENETTTSRNVEMMLLIKNDGAWKIVAQAWDREGPSRPIPPDLFDQAPLRAP